MELGQWSLWVFWAKWEHRVCPDYSSRAILKDFRCASVVCLLLWPGVGRKIGPSLAPWQVFEGRQKRTVIRTARPKQGTRKSTKRIFSSTPRKSNTISWWVHWVPPHLASKDGLKRWWTQCLSSGTLIAEGCLESQWVVPSRWPLEKAREEIWPSLDVKVKTIVSLLFSVASRCCSVELSQGHDVLCLGSIFLIKKKGLTKKQLSKHLIRI